MQMKHAKCVMVREGSVLAEAGNRHQPDPIHKGSDWRLIHQSTNNEGLPCHLTRKGQLTSQSVEGLCCLRRQLTSHPRGAETRGCKRCRRRQ